MDIQVRRFISLLDEKALEASFGVPKYYNTDFGNVMVIENVTLPSEYFIQKTSIAIKVIYGYNGLALFDMFWTYPYIGFAYGNIVVFPRASSPCDLIINNVVWQRWSRHYTEKVQRPITALQHYSWSFHEIIREAHEWAKFQK